MILQQFSRGPKKTIKACNGFFDKKNSHNLSQNSNSNVLVFFSRNIASWFHNGGFLAFFKETSKTIKTGQTVSKIKIKLTCFIFKKL